MGFPRHDFDFGDERLNTRAELSLKRIAEGPWLSFTKIFSESSELEGFYRLLHNERVEAEAITAGTAEESFSRVGSGVDTALAIHDTTTITPTSKELKEFEAIRGYWAHVSLLASADLGSAADLYGPVDLYLTPNPKQQQGRWLEQVESVERRSELSSKPLELIHVMDSEADQSALWSELMRSNRRFVIRVSRNRKAKSVRGGASKIFSEIEKAEILGTREVRIAKRSASHMPRSGLCHQSRDERSVKLNLSSREIEVHLTKRKSNGLTGSTKKTIKVHVVRAAEMKKASTGAKSVDWILITSEPIATVRDIERVVDIYRRRWVIEEYFKALKSGCQIEERRLGDATAWYNLTALLLPIASQVLRLKIRAYGEQNVDTAFFTKTQLEILRMKSKSYRLPMATYGDAQKVLARMGGHIKFNGPPGWITILRGYIDLLSMEIGFDLAREKYDK